MKQYIAYTKTIDLHFIFSYKGLFGLTYLSLSSAISLVTLIGKTYDIFNKLFSVYFHKFSNIPYEKKLIAYTKVI